MENRVSNTGEAADDYQKVSLTGQYLLAAIAIRSCLSHFGRVDHLLELGCGGGKSLWPSIPFVNQGGRVTGVDICSTQLGHIKENCKQISEYRSDLQMKWICCTKEDPIPSVEDGSVDVVQSSIALQEIREAGHLSRIMEEVYRVLRPGGIFVSACVGDRIIDHDYVSFTYVDYPQTNRVDNPFRACYSIEGKMTWENDRHWTGYELIESSRGAGFCDQSIRDVLANEELPPFPDKPWIPWADEVFVPPILMFLAKKPLK